MNLIDILILGIITIAALFSALYIFKPHFFSKKSGNSACTSCPCKCTAILYNTDGSNKGCEST